MFATDFQFNGGIAVAAAAGVVAIVRRRHAIGGWLLYFFFQLLLGLALVLLTTHWTRYLSRNWSSPLHYFLYTITSLSRLILLAAIAAVTAGLFYMRSWGWANAVKLSLVAYGFLTILKLLVDVLYFPESVRLDITSLAFPFVWLCYFSVSGRVRAVFLNKNWKK